MKKIRRHLISNIFEGKPPDQYHIEKSQKTVFMKAFRNGGFLLCAMRDTQLNFWYTSFYCIFWTDYYLTTEPSKFEPPAPFTFSEFDPLGKKPDRTYTKTELLAYLAHCRQKASQLIKGLTAEKLNSRWINDYKNFSLLEIFFYNVRHLQHHTAQLNLLLRQAIDNAPAWVSQAKK